jgi:hypothetical protein
MVLLALVSSGCGSSGTALPPGGDASPGSGGATPSRGGSTGTAGQGTGGAVATGGSTGGSVGTTGGSGGGVSTGGSPATGGSPGTGGAGFDAGAGCDCGAFAKYRACCGGKCVNVQNDPLNCGMCGNRCPAEKNLCEGGTCQAPPCNGGACKTAAQCCGASCCETNQICCSTQGPLDGVVSCFTPTAAQPTCPPGCAPLCISDRDLKQSIQPVDPQEVLDRLSRLPISRWRYRTEAEGVRHLGPMAQDFKAAFGLGDTDRAYYSVDAHGVAFAAIQALQKQAAEQTRRIEELERQKRTLERRLRALETRSASTPRGPKE